MPGMNCHAESFHRLDKKGMALLQTMADCQPYMQLNWAHTDMFKSAPRLLSLQRVRLQYNYYSVLQYSIVV
jgi:hypothetical protein